MTLNRLELVYDAIHKNPAIRFNDLMRETKLKNGTLTHYINRLNDLKRIKIERTPRITRFYDQIIPQNEAIICKYLTRPTIKHIIGLLLKEGTLSHIEIGNRLKKSSATVSVCLSELFDNKIIEKTYDIPSNKYSLVNPKFIQQVVNTHFPLFLKILDYDTIRSFISTR